MIYYKDKKTNIVYAYESEEFRREYGSDDIVEMANQEVEDHLNQNSKESSASQVTKAQGKAVLITSGLWQGVVEYINGIEDVKAKALAEVALNDTTHWHRSSPFLNSAAKSLGLSDEQLDDLFIQAEQIHL